jgi:hypothetical protein
VEGKGLWAQRAGRIGAGNRSDARAEGCVEGGGGGCSGKKDRGRVQLYWRRVRSLCCIGMCRRGDGGGNEVEGEAGKEHAVLPSRTTVGAHLPVDCLGS